MMQATTTMPYNTRRKSLSLPSLGIHVPISHSSKAATSRASLNHADLPANHGDNESCHPNKKIKRSHCYSRADTKEYDAATFDQTPPPSPLRAGDCDNPPAHVNIEGINDDIVEAVLVQLQSTGNRPHLVKELSAVLIQQLRIVQQSANPCAIISSRLSAYLKRPCWTASSPCPLAKELETVHPRRTYYYLTTSPPQPFPDFSGIQLVPQRSIMSPPSSSTPASTSGETDRRRELSPSPELDLPPLEFDIIPQPPVASQSVGSLAKKSQRVLPRATRGPSPPLEKDEKEFTQTADGLQKRKLTGNLLSADPIVHSMDLDDGVREESLFGEPKYLVPPSSHPQFAILTSPAIRPNAVVSVKKEADPDAWAQLDDLVEWDRSPENVELDELDGLLDDY